jgi:hypothetical protein
MCVDYFIEQPLGKPSANRGALVETSGHASAPSCPIR